MQGTHRCRPLNEMKFKLDQWFLFFHLRYDMIINPKLHATQSWIAQNCKKCPKCSSQIEKLDGCDHMTCTQCRHEFCWSCLANYNSIRRDGNHRHESGCKHYAPYHS